MSLSTKASMRPSTKVSIATITAFLVHLAVEAAKARWNLAIPPEVEGAIVALLAGLAAYVVSERHPAPSAVATVTRRQKAAEELHAALSTTLQRRRESAD